MIIHTLGPGETDSYQAAVTYIRKRKLNAEIILHPSFEEIYRQLEQLRDDYLIIPAAFRNQQGDSWGDLHYRYIKQLNLVDSLVTELDPLVLLQREKTSSLVAYTHAATIELVRESVDEQVKIVTVPSKYVAYRLFINNGRYVLTSRKFIRLMSGVKVKQEYATQMLWGVYQIGGRKDENATTS